MPKLESAELLHLRKTNVGHKVNIPHASVFRFTNIFIDESKRFMPGAYLQTYRGVPLWFSVIVAVLSFGGAATLTGAIIFLIFGFPFIAIYIDCPYFLRVARWLCFASLFGALVAGGGSKAIPVFFLVACLLFFLFYCQHEWVNQKTLPVVHKQPFIPGQKTLNSFYEVTITELDGIALQNYQAGIGFVELSQGKIEFQAFNNTAKKHMSDAKCQSRLMLLLFLAASVYNCYFVAAY